jgi:hypothetical protein
VTEGVEALGGWGSGGDVQVADCPRRECQREKDRERERHASHSWRTRDLPGMATDLAWLEDTQTSLQVFFLLLNLPYV